MVVLVGAVARSVPQPRCWEVLAVYCCQECRKASFCWHAPCRLGHVIFSDGKLMCPQTLDEYS